MVITRPRRGESTSQKMGACNGIQKDIPGMRQILRNCPHGNVGDRIWVKETYFAFGHWEQRFSDKKGRNEWHFVDQTLERGGAYKYEADGIPDGFVKHKRQEGPTTWWRRSSLFMPRAASRITLEIIDVRIERLQDISEADAIAEGAKWAACGSPQEGSHKAGFAQLWERINGQDSWAANPWVWCIQFKRVANEVNE